MGHQHAQGDHRYEKFHARTFFRNYEQSGRRIDVNSVRYCLDPTPPGECGCNFRGDILQWRNDFVTKRDEKRHIGERKRQDEACAQAENAERGSLKRGNDTSLRD